MGINHFFLLLFSSLLMIFFLFQPVKISEQTMKDIPLFSISKFSIYELDADGLSGFLSGKEGVKYIDRYTIASIDYTDKSKKFIANMKATDGIYKDSKVELRGDVVYEREDGLIFKAKEVSYDKKNSTAFVDGNYICYMGKNSVVGSGLKYDNLEKKLTSNNIVIKYQLGDFKW